MRSMIMAAALGGAFLTLGGCMTSDSGMSAGSATQPTATAMLRTATGQDAGRAVAMQTPTGLRLMVEAMGQTPGAHGVHVHTTGRCDAPDFTTAGGHWNPTSTKHGTLNPQGPHHGDMPNLSVGADGRGTVAIDVPSATLAGMLDADGAAFVIHAGQDDLRTDPSGNSGGRVACGVFVAS